MPSLVTLLELRTEVREQTDSVDDPHISDATLTGWVNRGVRAYFAMLIDADEDRMLASIPLSTTAGTLEYALPASFHSIRGLDLEGNGGPHTLRSYRWEERNRRNQSGMAASALNLPRYRVARSGVDASKGRLVFDINPGTQTYTHHYIQVPEALVADGDSVDDVLGFSDYVIAFAAKRVRAKRDEPVNDEMMEMARVSADIASQASKRHSDGFEKPPKVRRKLHRNNPMRW